MLREKTYRCKECWDAGFVSVIHPKTVYECRRDPDSFIATGVVYSAAARCSACARGADMGEKIPLHDQNMMVPWPHSLSMLTGERLRQAVINECREHVTATSDWESAQEFT